MSLNHLSDQILLQKSKLGDERAFRVLFTRYFRPLLQIAKKYLKYDLVAEELVMDLMLWLWNKRFELEIEGSFDAYLYKAIRNKIISHLRKSVLETINLDNLFDHSLGDSNYTDSNLLFRETAELYNENLKKLSYQRRKVFNLSREHNKTYNEIAAELNISVNTVKTHMKYCLEYFRRQMKDHHENVLLLFLITHYVYFDNLLSLMVNFKNKLF